MADARQLKIKVSACKRLRKEVAGYEKEARENEERVQKMRDDGKDAYDIRKQEEVLQESYMMIPDSKSRLQKSLEDLRAFLEASSGDLEKNSQDVLEARELLLAVE